MTKAVAIVSGGLDSTTLLYDMISRFGEALSMPEDIHALSFDYGQRHKKELLYARDTCAKLGVQHDIIDISNITHLISHSALTSSDPAPLSVTKKGGFVFSKGIAVPEGHYAEDNMKLTVVPNRNMIMLSIAAGVMVNESAMYLGIGVHAGDHAIYPDCRPEFLVRVAKAIWAGNAGFGPFVDETGAWGQEIWTSRHELPPFLYAPFREKTKADIAFRALELGVPFEETWSCYVGGNIHCGKCGTCVERLEAIHEAGARWQASQNLSARGDYVDPTVYADSEFWKGAVSSGR